MPMRSGGLGVVFSLAVAGMTPACAQDTVSNEPLGAQADSVARAAEAAGFSGVVRIARGGVTKLYKGYGLANREKKIHFSPETVVQIGSNTKDFTAVAILQLQERGLLDIRDSIGKFFPDAPADKRGITLRQVMNHVGGLPDIVGGSDFEPVGREQFLARLWKAPLVSVPGTAEHYSNSGYSLLAAIIEKLSGTSYDKYVQDHILTPLGMHHTGFALPHFDENLLAHGYRKDVDIGTILSHEHPADGPYWNLRGNGGMSSTLEDMQTFYTALFTSSRLLKPETRALQFDSDAQIGSAGSDHVSWFIYERYPRLQVDLFIASNNAVYPAPRLRRAIVSAVGLPGGDNGPGAPVASAGQTAVVAPAVATLIRNFITVLNAGNADDLRKYVTDHFAVSPNGPPLEQRVKTLLMVAQNQGAITIVSMSQAELGLVDVAVRAAAKGPLVIRVGIEPGDDPRIRTLALTN